MTMKPRVSIASLALVHLGRAWKPLPINFLTCFAVTRRSLLGSRIAHRDFACLTAKRNHSFTLQHYDKSFFRCSRLFGSRPESGIPGEVHIDDDQTALKDIDQKRLSATLAEIRKLIGYETYDVALLLIEDEEMREANMESRGVDEATDILSFPFHDAVKPGEIEEPGFDIAEYYNLGDLLIDVPYVIRSCQDDQEYEQREGKDDDDDDEGEVEDDRGVSGAMATIYDPEQRIHMLLVHGMLHLVGYDHEDDDDYEEMVAKEEEILKALKLMP